MASTDFRCGYLLVRIERRHIAMFRFLLEAYDNVAYFTVLDRRIALLKITFTDCMKDLALAALKEMRKTIPFSAEPWPTGDGAKQRGREYGSGC